MKYKVHRIEVNRDNMQDKIEQFLKTLNGEVIAVIPNVTPYFMMYGAKIDFVLVIENIGDNG